MTNARKALSTQEEQKEVEVVLDAFREKHHNPRCPGNHPRIKFAFWQSDFQGGKYPCWHVMNEGPSHHSTLGWEGLKQWKIL